MPITLSVQTYRDEAAPLPVATRFDQLGGAIGRIAGNDLVLDDPGKYISRVHARVEYRDGGYYLLDVGSNPSMVNGRPAGPGRPVLLADRDQVLIGDYLLVVSLTPDAQAAPALQPFAPMSASPPSPLPAIPDMPANADDSLSGASILNIGGNPGNSGFDPLGLDLLATRDASAPAAPAAPAYRGAESDHASPELQAFPVTPARLPAQPGPSMAIPDDYDPLADFLPPRIVQPAPPMPPMPPMPEADDAPTVLDPATAAPTPPARLSLPIRSSPSLTWHNSASPATSTFSKVIVDASPASTIRNGSTETPGASGETRNSDMKYDSSPGRPPVTAETISMSATCP